MIRYMLDTNACIAVINNKPPAVRIRLTEVDPIEVAISEIVRYELAFGVCNSSIPEKNQANLTHFLRYVQVLEWTEAQSLAAD
ncbi:MAG: PIN domain-containing protein [Caldilineaceae bacterium]|nr:PIN domain-containing protein [Caldilineaceae bacterium]